MSNLFLTLITLLGFGNNTPTHDLRKQTTKEETNMKIINWFYMNLDVIALALFIIALVVFTIICFNITGLSGTESGMMRNFINGGMI